MDTSNDKKKSGQKISHVTPLTFVAPKASKPKKMDYEMLPLENRWISQDASSTQPMIIDYDCMPDDQDTKMKDESPTRSRTSSFP